MRDLDRESIASNSSWIRLLNTRRRLIREIVRHNLQTKSSVLTKMIRFHLVQEPILHLILVRLDSLSTLLQLIVVRQRESLEIIFLARTIQELVRMTWLASMLSEVRHFKVEVLPTTLRYATGIWIQRLERLRQSRLQDYIPHSHSLLHTIWDQVFTLMIHQLRRLKKSSSLLKYPRKTVTGRVWTGSSWIKSRQLKRLDLELIKWVRSGLNVLTTWNSSTQTQLQTRVQMHHLVAH